MAYSLAMMDTDNSMVMEEAGTVRAVRGKKLPMAGSPWVWLLVWGIAVVYTAYFATMIHRHTAVPYFDQQNYVSKTYFIAEQWKSVHPRWKRLDPNLVVDSQPAMRPPLMMVVPALLWGIHATPQNMAYAWLVQRMLFLMAGVWVLTRVVRDRRWAPAALCLLLGSQQFLQVEPNLYMMDLGFVSVGLFSAGLVAWAMQRHVWWVDLLAGVGTMAAFLVKPQGLPFIVPFLGIATLERVVWVFRAKGWRPWIALVQWVVVMGATVWLVRYLLNGLYGQAVKQQYAWGKEGYWNTPWSWGLARQVFPGVMPGWLLAAVVALGVWMLVRRREVGGLRIKRAGWVVVAFFGGVLSWLVFTLLLTYAVDPRIVWSIAPLTVCAGMIFLWRRWAWGMVGTLVAAGVFVLNMGIAAEGSPWEGVDWVMMGAPVVQQHPVAEVGEREAVKKIEAVVNATGATVGGGGTTVEVVTCGEYVDYAGMTLASRWMNHDQWSHFTYQQFPFGDGGFEVATEFDPQRTVWFVTRNDAPDVGVSARALLNMHAIEALIVDPASPIHGLFSERLRSPVHVPRDGVSSGDTLVLWHLKRGLTAKELRDSAAFILPMYAGYVGQEQMTTELATLEKAAASTQATPATMR
jgi:hypothetical protein